jgi:hypothetical protein
MFNNRFNSSKKDPLIEAVIQARAEGDLRRAAEALVNEEFGVFSRKAVVREQLAAYDAALETTYTELKEGNKENKEKKKEHEEKTGMEHIKKMGGFPGQSLKRTARELTKEEKKLADKDYDKDGKIESPKDEVWGSRLRAAKLAGKMEEEQIDEISKELVRSYKAKALGSKLTAQSQKEKALGRHGASYITGTKWDKTIDKREKGMKLANKMEEGKKAWEEETDYSAPDRAAVTKDNKPVVSSTASQSDTSGPSASDKAALTSKIKSIKETKLDEISKGLAIKAYKKSQADLDHAVDYHREGQRSDRLRKHLERKQGKNEKPGRGEGESRIRGNDAHAGRSEYATPTKSGKVVKGTQKAWAKQTGAKIERERNRPKPNLPEEVMKESIIAKLFAKHMKEDQSF